MSTSTLEQIGGYLPSHFCRRWWQFSRKKMSTLQEIQAQIAELQKQAQQMVEAQRQPIIEKMKAEIKTYGITAKELGLKDSKTPSKPSSGDAKPEKSPVQAKYKLGASTWSGLGRPPLWMKEYLQKGGKKEDLEIK